MKKTGEKRSWKILRKWWFTIAGICVAVVGVVLTYIALSAPFCPLTKTGFIGACYSTETKWEFYLGIFLLIIGATLGLMSMRMKSEPLAQSILNKK
jgi:uncharacterized membrane protein